jgi:hypothetical protein
MAAPQWKGDDTNRVDDYKRSTRKISDADKARTRKWMATNVH